MSRKHKKKNLRVPGHSPSPHQNPARPPQTNHPQRPVETERKTQNPPVDDGPRKTSHRQNDPPDHLASINAGLMKIGVTLDEKIRQKMKDPQFSLDNVGKLLQAVNTQLRLTRQIDRSANARDPQPDSRNSENEQHPENPS